MSIRTTAWELSDMLRRWHLACARKQLTASYALDADLQARLTAARERIDAGADHDVEALCLYREWPRAVAREEYLKIRHRRVRKDRYEPV